MKKFISYFILIVIVLTIALRRGGCRGEDGGQPPLAPPVIVNPKPEIVIPKLTTNILYDEYQKALELSKIHNMNLIVVFSADWCVYCQDLKKDIQKISQDKCLFCIIDIDKDKTLAKKWKVRNLPTSILINGKEEVVSQVIGYRKIKYESWINSL